MSNQQSLFDMMSNLTVSDDAVDAQVIQSMSSMSINDSGESVEEIKEGQMESDEPNKKLPIVDYLCYIQKYYAYASEAPTKLPVYALGDSADDAMKRFQHISMVVDIQMFQAVQFIKGLPDFTKLNIDDIVLSSLGHMMDLIVLEAARKYDAKTDSIPLMKNYPYTCLEFKRADFGDFGQYLFEFCKNMSQLKLDDTEYVLLKVIVFFSASPKYRQPGQRGDFLEPDQMEKYKRFYTEKLRKYISVKHSFSQNYFDWLCLTLKELHMITIKMVHFLENHKNGANFTPLIKEIWKIGSK